MKGKTINGFELKHQLGVGGMAEVWYAENRIGKKAAVKLLLKKFCNDDVIVARFFNEAKVMVKLEHPNIRQVYDYGEIDERPCIVMEYLDGDDLKGMMKNGVCFSDEELKKWWNQMVQALNYTHSIGVVHRDIKPSNIFIDRTGNIKLLDFGIAKINDSGSGTLTSSTLGTRIYMSPEQVKDPKRVDYHSDIYSLAVTFVHLLTGKAPYDCTTDSDFEIQLNIVTKPLDISALPHRWHVFLAPYLEKEPKNRPELTEFKAIEVQTPSTTKTYISEDTIIDNQPETDCYSDNVTKKDPRDLIFNVKGVSFVMKYIEGGTFNMGAYYDLFKINHPNYDYSADEDENPVHEVTLNSFYLGETVVTKQMYNSIMGNDTTTDYKHPISNISWNDCHEIIQKLNSMTGVKFRLPSEAEWEYAARGGNKSKGFVFAGSANIFEVAWYADNSDYLLHPVAMKQPNELGLYDMSGNVTEWCEDWYGQYDVEAQVNPKGPETGEYRVIRGGSWGYNAAQCRVTNRACASVDNKSCCNGVRLALSTKSINNMLKIVDFTDDNTIMV